MKAKDLIEKLKDYPDFEVELTHVELNEATNKPVYKTFPVTGIADIGHSDKKIVLDDGSSAVSDSDDPCDWCKEAYGKPICPNKACYGYSRFREVEGTPSSVYSKVENTHESFLDW